MSFMESSPSSEPAIRGGFAGGGIQQQQRRQQQRQRQRRLFSLIPWNSSHLVRIVLTIALAVLSLGPFSFLLVHQQQQQQQDDNNGAAAAAVADSFSSSSAASASRMQLLSPSATTSTKAAKSENTSQSSSFYDSEWQSSTIVVTLAFGNATQTHLLERLFHSLRTNGGWNKGRMAVLTDRPERYRKFAVDDIAVSSAAASSTKSGGIIILEAKPDDLHPTTKPANDARTRSHAAGTASKSQQPQLLFKREPMRYKRFKTLILDYLDEYYYSSLKNSTESSFRGAGGENNDLSSSRRPESSSSSSSSSPPYQYVVYIDVDVVVARPLTALLQDVQDQLIRKEVLNDENSDKKKTRKDGGNKNATPTAAAAEDDNDSSLPSPPTQQLPFMAMFTDCPTCARHNTNSGVILLHRTHSRPCLHEWNTLFLENADWGVYDQRYLRDIRSNGKCQIYTMPDHHRLYPTWKDMRLRLSATIVHNTNSYNAKKIPGHVQAKYFAHLLPKYNDALRRSAHNNDTSATKGSTPIPEVELF